MCTFDTIAMKAVLILVSLFLFAGGPSLRAQTGNVMGDAVEQSDECYSVTLAAEWQNGAVWFLETLDLSEPFVIDLKMNFGFNDAFGADGMVFVMQTVGTTLLGEPGGGLGFGGISPSLGVEFDTFQNTDFSDPASDHLALLKNGSVVHTAATNLAGPVSATSTNANIEDGADHLFRLVWDPATDVVEVWFDCELRITHTINLVDDVFGGVDEVFWGFTGSTGGLINTQTVCLDQFTLGLPDDVELCEGESIQLGVNGPADGIYNWTPVDGVSDPTIADPLFTPEVGTTYQVEFTDACGEIQSDEVTIDILSVDLEIGPDQAICEGELAEFTADVSAGATVTWGDGTPGTVYETDAAGGVEAVAQLGECTTFDAATVEIADLPQPDEMLPETVEFCAGGSFVLDATTENCDYWWDGITTPTLEVFDPGTYTVTLTNPAGCEQSFSTEVVVVTPPVAALPALVMLCEGESELLTAGTAGTYLWSTGAVGQEITVSDAGFYSVVLTDGPCETSAETEVQVTPGPEWPFAFTYDYCEGEPFELAPTTPGIAYSFDGEGPSVWSNSAPFSTVTLLDSLTGCAGGATLSFEVLSAPLLVLADEVLFCEGVVGTVRAGVYPDGTQIDWDTGATGPLLQVTQPGVFVAEVENACGADSQEVAALFEPCSCHAYVPNAFTPDSDGTNDRFFPVLECEPDSYVFRVFDRWGALLFSTTNPSETWSGDGGGGSHFVSPGVYVWQLQFTHSVSGSPVVVDEWGTVALVR